jgi:hypothetical protein
MLMDSIWQENDSIFLETATMRDARTNDGYGRVPDSASLPKILTKSARSIELTPQLAFS